MLARTMMDASNSKRSIANEEYLSEIDEYRGVRLTRQ